MPRRRGIKERERDAQAAALRSRGLNHRQIAAQLGWKSPASAVAAIDRALADMFREDIAQWRDLEIAKLDDLTRVVWQGMTKPHYLVSQGKVVRDEDGEKLIDHAKPWEGVDRLLKVSERRARLLGLDAPQRTKVEVSDTIDNEIEKLIEQLSAVGNSPVPPELPAAIPGGQLAVRGGKPAVSDVED